MNLFVKHSAFMVSVFISCALLSCKVNKQKNAGEPTTTNTYKKPNIVLLFVDDYGWSDIGYRNSTFNTPNLNQFKKESLDFTRAYIPTPTS
ncbi:hypothetical protein OEG92_04810 [Polaribacter sejongensis]|uniref:hypothetical protein n=1 Tax=Polaribacter sejongensis TaxID=985043 RepID=UPI0035A63035